MSVDGTAERRPFAFNRANGATFGEVDVARCYAHRPPYAPALYKRLLEFVPRRRRALDLGCGPGKIAIELAPHFDEVLAVDPSQPMLDAGQELSAYSNIRWIPSRAEDLRAEGRYDLITIGTAVHWMQHDIVFPRMVPWLHPEGSLAIISNPRADEPEHSERNAARIAFLTRWLARVGREYDPAGFAAAGRTYEGWMDIDDTEEFTFDFQQSLDDYTASEHSTATFARPKMGAALAEEFDCDLRETLTPFLKQGMLQLRVRSTLVWGKPRRSQKDKVA